MKTILVVLVYTNRVIVHVLITQTSEKGINTLGIGVKISLKFSVMISRKDCEERTMDMKGHSIAFSDLRSLRRVIMPIRLVSTSPSALAEMIFVDLPFHVTNFSTR